MTENINNNTSINNNINSPKNIHSSKEKESATPKAEDSKEKKDLDSLNEKAKQIAQIKERIKSGYYNSDDVINKVADSIIKEFDKDKLNP